MGDGSLLMTLLMGPKLAVPVPAAVTDALQSVQVTTAAGQASGFQLTFAMSKASLLNRVLLPTGVLDPGVRVIVMVVVNGRPSVLTDGIVTRQDVAPGAGPGGSTVTLTGEDLTAVMDMRERTACYPGMSSDEQVKGVVRHYAGYGIVPLAVPPVLREVPSPTERIQVQTDTDLGYVKTLAAQAGHVFYLEPGPVPGTSTAYWGPEIRIGVPQLALSVDMDAHANVESLSFAFDGRARTQMTVTVMEPFTRRQIPVPVPDVGLLRPPLAARRARALREAPVPDTAKLTPLGAALAGLSMTAEASDAVIGQGRLDVLRYGRVLKARSLVGVRGAGPAYDGLFYVRSVTHDIKRGEYKQSFTLARDGLVSQTPVVRP